MEDLSLHILDVAENSISSSAGRIEIRINEDAENDVLTIEIKDDGKGMDEQTLQKALDPFFTTRTTRRVGLGLPLLAQAARETDGKIELHSSPGQGTTVRATFCYSTRIASRWAIFKKPYARLLWGILKSPFCMNTRRMVQFIVLIQER
jgi:signal transduction histidine kinase